MQSSIEQLGNITYKVVIEVPAEQVDEAVEKRLRKIGPSIRLHGFRPGKVPPNVIKQKYGASVRQEVLSELIESSYNETIEGSGYSPIDQPKIELISGFSQGEELKFTAIFEVMPEVEVKGLDELKITLPQSELTDTDVDKMIETLRQQRATYIHKDSGAEESDRVTVDFIGKIDGEPFEGGSGEDMKFTIGGGQMLPDFEEGLRGAVVNEERSFDVHFPEDYHSQEIAGKIAQFTATVKNVESMQLPEVDADFIKWFGLEGSSYDGFKQTVRDNMSRELENALRRIKRSHMLDAVLEKNAEQPIPEAMVEREKNHMIAETKLEQQIKDKEKIMAFAQQYFDEPARRRVQLIVLLGELFKQYDLELDNERVKQRLDTIASTYEDPDEVRTYYNSHKEVMANLESAILEEQLIDKLYEKAEVVYEDKTFQEVLAINANLRN